MENKHNLTKSIPQESLVPSK